METIGFGDIPEESRLYHKINMNPRLKSLYEVSDRLAGLKDSFAALYGKIQLLIENFRIESGKKSLDNIRVWYIFESDYSSKFTEYMNEYDRLNNRFLKTKFHQDDHVYTDTSSFDEHSNSYIHKPEDTCPGSSYYWKDFDHVYAMRDLVYEKLQEMRNIFEQKMISDFSQVVFTDTKRAYEIASHIQNHTTENQTHAIELVEVLDRLTASDTIMVADIGYLGSIFIKAVCDVDRML